jgi:two-component system, OmpR family, response regulator
MGRGMESKTIVVVEDNATIAQLIKDILNDVPGYGAVSLGDGDQAMMVITAVRADLAILDVDLPRIGGLQIAAELRRTPQTAAIPILFMSAGEHRATLARAGFHDFLAKPFDLDDLLARVARLLARAPGESEGHSELA